MTVTAGLGVLLIIGAFAVLAYIIIETRSLPLSWTLLATLVVLVGFWIIYLYSSAVHDFVNGLLST
jgi:hypothetical protein